MSTETSGFGMNLSLQPLSLSALSVSAPSIKPLDNAHLSQLTGLLAEVEASGAFQSKDTALALEIIKETPLKRGYAIKVIESQGIILGFICYRKAALSERFFELCWTAVRPSFQGHGFGRMLLEDMENDVRNKKGKAIILDTSSDESYAAARHLYEERGYKLISKIENFYDDGEHKLVYKKEL